MKLKYEKPKALVEFYKLSQSIAACDIKINNVNNQCVVQDRDTPIEMRSFALDYFEYFSTGCDIVCTNNPDYDGLCYHTQVNSCWSS